VRERCTEGRLAARRASSGGSGKTVTLGGLWRLAVSEYCQAVWSNFRLAAHGQSQAKILLFFAS